jgi:hypothetical protein
LKFFGLVTAGQFVLITIMAIYYWNAGLPHLNPSSPAYLYWWPVNYGEWGHASFFIFFVGPVVLFAYSIVATLAYALGDSIRTLLTRKY